MKQALRILLATDYSGYAKGAEHYAIELAQKGHALGVLHIYNPPLTGALSSFEPADPIAYEMKHLQEHFSNLLKTAGIEASHINYKCMVNDGINIAESIVEAAEEFEADLIVMGTHGSGKLNEVLMGSHTWDATRVSNIPILAVPDKAKFRMPEDIAFVTACQEGELPAMQFISAMAAQFEAKLTIVHFSELTEIAQKTEQDFDTKIRSMIHYPRLTIKKIVYDPDVDRLQEYCKKSGTEWIVISPQKLAAWNTVFKPQPETAHLMNSTSQIPLLIVPDYSYLVSTFSSVQDSQHSQ